MERFGFVGLPNAGKSSLYNALAGGGALAAPYAFATTDPNVGVAQVPDPRLDALAEMSESQNVVPATVQFVDIGGLVAGASKGEGLGNKFLSHIREADAIVFVLRAFADDDVPGPSDPLEHLGVVELELTYADLETVENQIEKRRKAAKGDKSLVDEVAALDQAKAILETGTPIYRSDLEGRRPRACCRPLLPAHQPAGAWRVVNVGEDQLDDIDAVVAPVRDELAGRAEVIGMCVQLEAEAAQLDADERAEMLEGLGLGEGALPRFLHAAYQLLGLRTFLTTGDKESRAWTFRAGYKAPQCAGVIHGDFERGLHPGRGHPLGRAARARVVEQGQGRRQAPRRGQGLRGRRTATSSRSASTSDARRSAVASSLSDAVVAPRRGGAGVAGGGRPIAPPGARGCSGRTASRARCCSCPARSVHSLGMRFPIDVAWLDADLTVLRTVRLARNRMTRPVLRAHGVLEAEAGSFARWSLAGRRPARAARTDRCRSSWSARPSATSATSRPAPSRRSPRADAICCEDTRRTGRLLQHAGRRAPARSIVVNDHTEARAIAGVLERLARGERVAVVTDAGMPGISDPGERLVRAAVDAGHPVEVVPGPSAAITALVASGLPTGRFVFEGFLPRKGSGRTSRLAELAAEPRTIVLYEAPHRAGPHPRRPGRAPAVPSGGCRSAAS